MNLKQGKALRYFKHKKILFAHWDSENKKDYSYQQWYLPLKKIFGEVLTFSPKNNYFNFGKERMNSLFLEIVKREKPDLIFFLLLYDEFDPITIVKAKQLFPNTIFINLFGDDSWRYEDYGRYYALFFDYIITAYHKAVGYYKKDGIKKVSFTIGVNLDNFKPLTLPKKYDVVFIGRPGNERSEFLSYLVQKGIKIDIWGEGWESYPKLANHTHGPLSHSDWVRIVNESKINLSFSQGGDGKPQIKGRPFEVSACNSFSLVGYFSEYKDFFKEGKEIVMFKDKEDLLKKIRYYLQHEKERDKIAKAAYRKVTKKYSQQRELKKLFSALLRVKKQSPPNFTAYRNKVCYLTPEEVKSNKIDMVKNYDYIGLIQQGSEVHPYKEYFQAYSLEKSGKDISCCDYYISDTQLGNYLLFKASLANRNLGKKEFNALLTPSQIMMKKDFFIKNIDKIKGSLFEKEEIIVDTKNSVFVSIPLVSTSEFPHLPYYFLQKAFQTKFLDILYALHHQNKILEGSYLLKLLVNPFYKSAFFMRAIKDALLNPAKRVRLKKALGFFKSELLKYLF